MFLIFFSFFVLCLLALRVQHLIIIFMLDNRNVYIIYIYIFMGENSNKFSSWFIILKVSFSSTSIYCKMCRRSCVCRWMYIGNKYSPKKPYLQSIFILFPKWKKRKRMRKKGSMLFHLSTLIQAPLFWISLFVPLKPVYVNLQWKDIHQHM